MFETKDSGQRTEFSSGMVRDTAEGKTLWHLVADGPMLKRWAELLTRGAVKYSPGNWLKAEGEAEHNRFRESAFRHFMQWYRGDRDEDHGAAVMFNVNGAEYVRDKLASGAKVPLRVSIIADDPKQQELADHVAFIDNLILEHLKTPKILITGSMDYPENAAESGLVEAFDESIWERYDESLPSPYEFLLDPPLEIIPYRPSLWQRLKAGVAKTLFAIAFEIDFVTTTETALDAGVCP